MLTRYEAWLAEQLGPAHVWWAELLTIVVGAVVLSHLAGRLITALSRWARRTANEWDDALIEALSGPVVWLVWLLGLNLAIEVGGRQALVSWGEFIGPANRILIVTLFALFLIRFVRLMERRLAHAGGDAAAQPAARDRYAILSKLLQLVVVVPAALIVLGELGLQIAGVLAFGGIGGIVVGLAARDLLANLFGGLMLHLNRPFSVGDWIRSSDREIEGVVEEIGWHQTRIRTFQKRALYVPNAVFNTISVENPSQALNYRIYENIGVRHADIGVMDKIVEDVKKMLLEHPEIDHAQTMVVTFNSLSLFSAEFMVYTFTRTVNWAYYKQVKQDVLLKITDIIERHGARPAMVNVMALEKLPS